VGNETVVQMYMVMASAQFENENRWMNPVKRQKLTGSICSFCATPLPRGPARRQTYCEHCPPAGAHHVRMDFHFVERRWHCRFWDADAAEMLPASLRFEHADSLYTLARRGRGFIGAGRITKLAFLNSIGNGRGAISLTLDNSQYQALRAAGQRETVQTSTLTEGK
jgi:hypothetical protein